MNELEKTILKTLVWFDIFDFPLTAQEILHYFLKDSFGNKQQEIRNSFDLAGEQEFLRFGKEGVFGMVFNELINKKKIAQKNEFYFLKGREEILKIRKQRKDISLKKIKKAKRLVNFLKFVPEIEAIFLCNSVGYLNAKTNSDIDLFIITKSNRIWTARWWSVGWLKLFNLRPSAKNKKDKFCLSYFVSQDNLNLEPTKMREFDISLIYWLTTFQPLYYKNDLWSKFIKANEWIKKYLPNFIFYEFKQNGSKQEFGVNINNADKVDKNIIKNIFDWQEKTLKKIQLWYLPKELKKASQESNNKVIINDKMLKFHLTDKRQADFEKWNYKINQLNLNSPTE